MSVSHCCWLFYFTFAFSSSTVYPMDGFTNGSHGDTSRDSYLCRNQCRWIFRVATDEIQHFSCRSGLSILHDWCRWRNDIDCSFDYSINTTRKVGLMSKENFTLRFFRVLSQPTLSAQLVRPWSLSLTFFGVKFFFFKI
jgi:hypothetical protein